MPKISVITIAKTQKELEKIKNNLESQTFQDFEFIGSTKGTIPEAWNDAIDKANGDYFVFTESDAQPLNDDWLEQISMNLQDDVVLKGIEIAPTNLNMCNLVGRKEIFKEHKFDETFAVAEDTELFARLRKNGVEIKRVDSFPVKHTPSISWGKTIQRSFTYGFLLMKIMNKYGMDNMDTINTMNKEIEIHPVSNRLRIIVDNFFFLNGLIIGSIANLFSRKKRK